MKIGVLGGTGKEGKGIVIRWGRAGHTVIIGSRDAEKGKALAAELSAAGHGTFIGASNEDAAKDAELVLLSIPYTGHAETLKALKPSLEGKIVVDITVPLAPPKITQVHLPPGTAAALEAQAILTGSKVVGAMHHVSAAHLADLDHVIECDVLVCGDDEPSRAVVIGLMKDLGLRGLDAGPLRNAVALESLTPILLHLNRKYKSPGAGVKFTNIP